MLLLAVRIQDLSFGKLMSVYIEGNQEKAEEFPDPAEGLLQAEQDFYQYLKQVFFPVDSAFYAVWVENEVYCSALRMEPYKDGLLLEALETAPELRRRGYASKLIHAVLDQLGDTKVYSHVSKTNEASLAVHARCGFRKVLDHAVYLDGSVRQNVYTLLWKNNEDVE